MPLLPNAAGAIVPEPKLREYVMNPDARDNKGKAASFSRLGYERGNWQRLEEDLRPASNSGCN
jgi:hypothetical protein